MTDFPRCALLVVPMLLSCVSAPAEAARKGPPPQTTVAFATGEIPMILDAGRVLLDVAFETPEGERVRRSFGSTWVWLRRF